MEVAIVNGQGTSTALRGLREPGWVGNRGFLEGKGGEKLGGVFERSNLGSLSTHHLRHAPTRAIVLPSLQLIDFLIFVMAYLDGNSGFGFQCGLKTARLTGMEA